MSELVKLGELSIGDSFLYELMLYEVMSQQEAGTYWCRQLGQYDQSRWSKTIMVEPLYQCADEVEASDENV